MLRRRAGLALLVASGGMLAAAAPAAACGIFWEEPGPRLIGERALVTWDGTTEEMVLRLELRRRGKVAVIVPVPATPQVRTLPRGLFTYLGQQTRPLIKIVHQPRRIPTECVTCGGGADGGDGAPKPAVRVVSRKSLGRYDVAVLRAGRAGALRKYLDQEGFKTPPGAGRILDRYVRRKWAFVALRLRPSGPREGHLKPIRLSFRTRSPVYPTQLTSLNSTQVDMSVYTLMPHRMRLGNLATHFAGYVDRLERRAPAAFAGLFRGLPYLTKLADPTVRPASLRRDLVARRATSDATFRRVETRIVYDLPPLLPPRRPPGID